MAFFIWISGSILRQKYATPPIMQVTYSRVWLHFSVLYLWWHLLSYSWFNRASHYVYHAYYGFSKYLILRKLWTLLWTWTRNTSYISIHLLTIHGAPCSQLGQPEVYSQQLVTSHDARHHKTKFGFNNRISPPISHTFK